MAKIDDLIKKYPQVRVTTARIFNKDAKYQITQMGKEPHVIEFFEMFKVV